MKILLHSETQSPHIYSMKSQPLRFNNPNKLYRDICFILINHAALVVIYLHTMKVDGDLLSQKEEKDTITKWSCDLCAIFLMQRFQKTLWCLNIVHDSYIILLWCPFWNLTRFFHTLPNIAEKSYRFWNDIWVWINEDRMLILCERFLYHTSVWTACVWLLFPSRPHLNRWEDYRRREHVFSTREPRSLLDEDDTL